MSFEQSETDRKLSNTHLDGVISAVDYKAKLARITVGDWTSAWRPWRALSAGAVAHWCPPTVGEGCSLKSPSGLVEQGIICPGLYTDSGTPTTGGETDSGWDWPDKSRQYYDHDKHAWTHTLPDGGSSYKLDIGSAALEITQDKFSIKIGGATLSLTAAAFSVDLGGGKMTLTSDKLELSGTLKALDAELGTLNSVVQHTHTSTAPGSPTTPPTLDT